MSMSDLHQFQRTSYQPNPHASTSNRPSLPTGTIAAANASAPLSTPSAAERAAYLASRPAAQSNDSDLNPNGKRPPSAPMDNSSLGTAVDDRPNKFARTLTAPGKGNEVFDLRAEEEALRRANMSRASYGNARYTGGSSRAKKQDLVGETALRERMNRIATQFGMTIDEESINYIALSAEIRIRSLLRSSISAQNHRVSSTHLQPPPLVNDPSSSTQSGSSKAMWSLKINNDQNTLFEIMARQNREEEQTIRMERMERLARESELAKAREKAEREYEYAPPPPPINPTSTNSDNPDEIDPTAGPSSSSSAIPPNPQPANPDAPPVFGAVKELSKIKKPKKPMAAAKDVSAEVAHKLSNAMAMRSAGVKTKYAWMTGAPVGPSPLGKKKKDKERDGEGGGDLIESGTGTGPSLGVTGVTGGNGQSGRSNPPSSTSGPNNHSTNTTNNTNQIISKPKPTIPVLSIPARRTISVQPLSEGEKRYVTDDRALTLVDVVFALENERGQKGMGSTDDIIRKIYSKPGGPFGSLS